MKKSLGALGKLSRGPRAAMAIVAFVLAVAAALAVSNDAPFGLFSSAHVEVDDISLELKANGSRLGLTLRAGSRVLGSVPFTLRLVDDASRLPLPLGRPARAGQTIVAPVLIGGGGTKTGKGSTLSLTPVGGGVVRIDLVLGDDVARPEKKTLALELPNAASSVFVEGVGEVADVADVTGAMLVASEDPFALAIAPPHGALSVALSPGASHTGPPKIVRVDGPAPERDDARTRTLFLAASAESAKIYGALAKAMGRSVLRVAGVTTGAAPGTHVFGVDDEGKPRVRALVDAGGRFAIDVPKNVNRWYAAIDEARTSPPIFFEPGAGFELRLDVSPGGELVARVLDADARAPLVARLVVRGIDGTRDPSFGPDYRASGAGPLVDALRGEVTTPLPAGRYRVSATKGIEWNIDAADVTIASGERARVELNLRHVVDTTNEVGCDLHVHARPSFDTPVSTEDRVLSLVAAGVDFAVPTEHNVVGDYGPSLETLGLERSLAWVHGVEVTTYSPRFGHFGVFPVPGDAGVPPYRGTTPAGLFAAVRRDKSSILQVNHPRLPKDIGYFEKAGFDPRDKATFARVRIDFDALEVYNGFDLQHLARVEAVLADYYALLEAGRHVVATGSSDAHRIQYNWAGYPRTMVKVPSDAAPLDPNEVIAGLKAGHAIVTSGPMLDVALVPDGGASVAPGDESHLRGKGARVDVTVRAAPWIDVTDVELVVNGRTVETRPIEPRPTVTGPELGSLAEARARTVRGSTSFAVPKDARWVMVLARGKRLASDVLPFMPYVPFAFSNPIWIVNP
ncbi:MAG: CehA/McbA family metallohydrolase [Polyangiaceae bacterium]